jgi:biopolymer transport protein ExbD
MAAPVQRPGELISGINVTPLVDVVLVLLIILMVTAKFAASQTLPMDLPQAKSGESSAPTPLAISVDASGALYLDGKALSKDELRLAVRQHGARPDESALIAADGAVPHRAVVGVIDLLRSEGITKLAINVAPEDLGP